MCKVSPVWGQNKEKSLKKTKWFLTGETDNLGRKLRLIYMKTKTKQVRGRMWVRHRATGIPKEEKVLQTSAVEDFPDPGLVTYSVGRFGKGGRASGQVVQDKQRHGRWDIKSHGGWKSRWARRIHVPGKRAEQKERWLMVEDPQPGQGTGNCWVGGLSPAPPSPSPYPWHYLPPSHKQLSAIILVPVTFKIYHKYLLASFCLYRYNVTILDSRFIHNVYWALTIYNALREWVRLGPTLQEHCPPLRRKGMWTGWVNCWIMYFWLFATLHSIHTFNSNVLIT